MFEKIRDGISQQIRRKTALHPDYVRIDERSLRDNLQFIIEYSKNLQYFDGNNNSSGDWSIFFQKEFSIDDVIAFIKDSTSLPEEKKHIYQQPHFVLLFSFLGLLDSAKEQLNGLTKRHLDFYFRDILQLQKKKAVPDHVNVLVDLAKYKEAFVLPAGSLLHAGKDNMGRQLAYQTDEDRLLNNANIAQLRTIYLDKKITEIGEIVEKYLVSSEIIEMIDGKEKKFEGNSLIWWLLYKIFGKILLSSEEIDEVIKNFNFIKDKLKISFSKFRELKIIKDRREKNDREDWGKINIFLEKAGRRKRDNNEYKLPVKDAQENEIKFYDFDQNFINALDEEKQRGPYNHDFFAGLSVSNIDELYEKYQSDIKSILELIEKINNDDERKKSLLALVSDSDESGCKNFGSMMLTRKNINDDWSIINEILNNSTWKPMYSDENFFLKFQNDTEYVDIIYSSIELLNSKYSLSAYNFYTILKKKKLKNSICDILASCKKNKENTFEEEDWNGIYANDNVKYIQNSNDIQRWKTFGQSSSNSAELGFAISSPILLLSQGARTITLSVQLLDGDIIKLFTENKDIFHVIVSTEGGWKDLREKKKDSLKIEKEEGKNNLLFIISIPPEVEEIIYSEKCSPSADKKWPTIKIILNDTTDKKNVSFYKKIRNVIFSEIQIKVSIDGMSDFKIWNDEQVIDSKKPFEPFGSRPIVGSGFYIAHNEFVEKKISKMTFNINWAGIDKLNYKNYDEPKEINDFKVEINRETVNLFKKNDKEKFTIEVYSLIVKDEIIWKLLDPDFQHSNYPIIAAKKAIELSIAIAKKENFKHNDYYFVHPPYTPVIEKLIIDYSCDYSNELTFFHIYPFGYAEAQSVQNSQKQYQLLPQFDNAGELYIGIENFKPPQQLNVLFQMAEGTADASLSPEIVHWDYLSGNKWESLEDGKILADGTRGLINSGIIKFSLPISEPNTLLPPELYWLRASIKKYPGSVCDLIDIHTQAVSATLVDNNTAPDHFNQPLAKDTITRLVNSIPEIKGLRQPYTSFGGKSAEQDELFYTRVSERLRHKQRALTQWDYEHLVLERFPQIYKVKCLSQFMLDTDDEPAGTVIVIVIPNIRNLLPADPFEPKAPVNLLLEIQDYLLRIAPDSATIAVKNADYVRFSIRMAVQFNQGYDEGYYKNKLNEDINRFLAPWAYAEGADIVIGGKIYANSIINFVERLDYIDYIGEIEFFPEELSDDKNKPNCISSASNSVVLVPEREHTFDPISKTGYKEELFQGINYWKIELDFIVS